MLRAIGLACALACSLPCRGARDGRRATSSRSRRSSTRATGTRARRRRGAWRGRSRSARRSRPCSIRSRCGSATRRRSSKHPFLLPGRRRARCRPSTTPTWRACGAACRPAASSSSTAPIRGRAAASISRCARWSARLFPREPLAQDRRRSRHLQVVLPAEGAGRARRRGAVPRRRDARRAAGHRLLAERPRRRVGARQLRAVGARGAARAATRSARWRSASASTWRCTRSASTTRPTRCTCRSSCAGGSGSAGIVDRERDAAHDLRRVARRLAGAVGTARAGRGAIVRRCIIVLFAWRALRHDERWSRRCDLARRCALGAVGGGVGAVLRAGGAAAERDAPAQPRRRARRRLGVDAPRREAGRADARAQRARRWLRARRSAALERAARKPTSSTSSRFGERAAHADDAARRSTGDAAARAPTATRAARGAGRRCARATTGAISAAWSSSPTASTTGGWAAR